jgi:uncharacterized membrane protein YadS
MFVVYAIVNSTGILPPTVLEWARRVDLWLLCGGWRGLQTGFSDLREAGLKPIAAGAIQWGFLAVVSYALARWLCG